VRAAGNADVRVDVLPGVGHSVFVRQSDGDVRVVPEAGAAIRRWLRGR
jgi:hypothetical protein